MTTIALVLLLLAALFGVYMASKILRGVLPPVGPALVHGALAAAGLVVVLYAIITGAQSAPMIIGGAFLVVAALSGFFAASFHMRKSLPPETLVVIHALVAVAGVGTLLASVLGVI